VFTGGAGTSNSNNSIATLSPIVQVTRGAQATPNGVNNTSPVTFLDPTPQNDALSAVGFAPNDGFFSQARFKGAFPRGNNWLIGWTGTARFGLTTNSKANTYISAERPGIVGAPVHYTIGNWAGGTSVTPTVDNIDPAFNIAIFVLGTFPINFPLFGGIVVPTADFVDVRIGAGGTASAVAIPIPLGLGGSTFWTQFASFDLGVPSGEFAFSNAQKHILP
jgi:hypothetical protein